MALYLYRRGDGNEGNFPRRVVDIPDDVCLASALRALVVNDFIPGRSRRRFIAKHLEADSHGREYGATAEIYQGPRGVTAYDACWLTAELQPITPQEGMASYYLQEPVPLMEALDKGARRLVVKA